MAASKREQELESALRDLVEACGCVRPISRDVSFEKVRDVRFAMRFMAAWEAAKSVLAEELKNE